MDLTNMRVAHIYTSGCHAQGALRETHDAAENSRMSLGPNIRRIRKAKGLTLQAMAADIDWDQANLTRVEKEQQWPSQERLEAIARCLEVPVWLLFKDDAEQVDAPAEPVHWPFEISWEQFQSMPPEFRSKVDGLLIGIWAGWNLIARKRRPPPPEKLAASGR